MANIDVWKLESLACAKARVVRVEASWNELIGQAREVMAQALIELPAPVYGLYELQNAAHLVVAARVFDAAAQWMPAHDKSDREAQRQTGLLAALTFGACGNFPSSNAVLQRTFPTLRPHASEQAALMAVAAPSLLCDIEKHCPADWATRDFFALFADFLQTGEGDCDEIRAAWLSCVTNESELSRAGRLCLEHAFELSAARVLKQAGALREDYVARLAQHIPLLMPPQWTAIRAGLLNGGNALISLPPGTGKTLLGELCLMAALGAGPGLAVFVAPYVALGRQVARTLEKHLPADVRVRRCLGGSDQSGLQPQIRGEVLVATPEKLDGLLRTQPHLREHLKIVVCDEAHLVGGDARGARLEGLLTRLRLMQSSGQPLRIVALSAALGESEELRGWLDARIFAADWRPTARRVALWTSDGKLRWRGDDASQSGFSLPFSWPQPHVGATNHWPAVERQQPILQANAAFLAKHLNESLGGAVLCVCATRRGTRQMAHALAQVFAPREGHGALAGAIEIIEKRHRVLRPLADLLRCGVAWHNASLPHDVRSLIEEAIENGELEAVAATTTLAEGADFPFRSTVLVEWLHWSQSGQRPLAPQLFRNIAGRCGRAGAFTEGDTIIVDNPLGDLKYTAPEVRRACQEQTFFASLPAEPQSVFEKDSDTSPLLADTLRATLASQFMAVIAENPRVPELQQWFLKHTYATRRGADLREEVETIARELEEGGFAQRDETGGWSLTDLGCAANGSELSPATCVLLLKALRDLKTAALPVSLTDRIAFAGARLLRVLGICPEQSHNDLKNVLLNRRSRFCVKPDDFEMVLQLWLRGQSPAAIFGALPFARRSSRQINIEDWVEGDAAQDEAAAGWQNELDKFVDFSRHVLEVFLPWILRSSERLAPFADAQNVLPWSLAAQFVEAGVDSRAALKMLTQQAPGTRQSLAALGRHDGKLEPALREVGGKYCDAGKNLLETWQWLENCGN